jgi:hypothetical protein
MSKKSEVLEELYKRCLSLNAMTFHNNEVKEICTRIGFANAFDVTKLDSSSKLPKYFKENDIAVLHLGSGNHCFIKGIDSVYHTFEPITETVRWEYQKSLLNQFNSSESNVLSVANNQRILHHFLFDQDHEFADLSIEKRPKTYFPHRTKTSFHYYVNGVTLELKNIQIEIDLTLEFNGKVGVFEAKNGIASDFSIYQIYHPFLYYHQIGQEALKGKLKTIFGVYVFREHTSEGNLLKLWAYTFTNPLEMSSIQLVKSREYLLIEN